MEQEFTKYEIARIIGARALQISMDAPILIKLTEKQLEALNYDSLKIADYEFNQNVLPISISRPTPRKKKEKLSSLKEEEVSDEELIAKAQEVEQEITREAKEYGLINEGEDEESLESERENFEENQ